MDSEEIKEEVIKQFLDASKIEIKEILEVPKEKVYHWITSYGYTKELEEILNKIMELASLEKYEEAINLCNSYCTIPLINMKKERIYKQISKKIKAYMKEQTIESTEKAYQLCCQFQDSKLVILSQKFQIMMIHHDYEGILKEYKEEYFKINPCLLSQKITALIELGRPEDALIECKEERSQTCPIIRSQKVNAYIHLKMFKQALKECKEKYFEENPALISQKVTILIIKGQWQDALLECTDERCLQNPRLQKQKKRILKHFKQEAEKNNDFPHLEEILKKDISPNSSKEELVSLLNQLYSRTLSLNDIDASSLCEWQKTILRCAYYEQTNPKAGLIYLKRQLLSHEYTIEETKTLKSCIERLKMNKKIFDITYYNQLLLNDPYIQFQEEHLILKKEKQSKQTV